MSLKVIKKAMAPLQSKIRLMLGRCVLNGAVDKGILAAQVEALEGETIEDAERLENYGLAGHPPAGAEGALLCIGGARDHPLIVGMEHREHRPEIIEGEVKIYSMFKQFIHLDKDGNIRIKAPKGIIIEAESFEAGITKGISFQSENYHAAAENDIALTSRRFGVAASESATVDSGLTATKDITSKAQIRDHKGTMQQMRDVYNPHTHPGVSEPNPKM